MAIAAMVPEVNLKDSTYDLIVAHFTPDASWLAAGEVVSIAGHGPIASMMIEPQGGYSFRFVASSQKIIATWGDNNNAADSAGVAVPDATDISAIGPVLVWALVEN